MKETRFIAQNKEKWQESENLLKESEKDPERLSNLFTQVIDDLSFSRTYYPNRSVRVYLNNVAREYFSLIYKHHHSGKNAFRNFWMDELPQIVHHSRKPLLLSLVIFFLSASIGVFSAINDPQFTSTILGDRYVTMTQANIEKGDPMAVYKQAHEVDMFLGITLNNLMVAFRTYVFGIFLSIGTIAILLYNGIMVGCFQYFFIERGLFVDSALTIWLHGTLEISSIILAGGAGLTLGSGLLFPGTYSRLQAFQITAIRSLKLMLGIAPIFVLAGIIESFLTRYTEVPDLIRLFLILLSLVFVVGYFVVYPWMKSRAGFEYPLKEVRLAPDVYEPAAIGRIKNNGEILKDTFAFYKKYGGKLFSWIALVTFGMSLAEVFSPTERTDPALLFEPWLAFLNNLYYALKTPTPVYLVINVVGTSLILYKVFTLFDRSLRHDSPPGIRIRSFLQTVVVTAVIYLLLWGLGAFGNLLILFAFSFFLLFAFTQSREETDIVRGLIKSCKLSAEGFGQAIGLHFILVTMSFSFLLILSAPLLYMNTSILQWNFAESDKWVSGVVRFIDIFARIFAVNLILPIFAISIGYLYFTLCEVLTADHLHGAIAQVGRRSNKGLKV